jgi:hypothetical protein
MKEKGREGNKGIKKSILLDMPTPKIPDFKF